MKEKKRIAMIGSQDLAQQITHLIHSDSLTHKVVGFYDDFLPQNTTIKDLPVLGKIVDIEKDFSEGKFEELLIGIGYKHFEFRKKMFETFSEKIPFATFVHSSCIIDPSAKISAGVVLYPHSVIDQNVVILENVLVNLGCCISHESLIEKHCYLSPRVAIAGKVQLGECSFVGINATIIDDISIVANTVVGASANVIKDIKQSGVYIGNPAKKK